MNRCLLLSLIAAAALIGCTSEEPSAPPGESAAVQPNKEMLPAFETEEEHRLGKADQFSEYRAMHPELYGYTAGPTGTVVAAGQHEPAGGLFIAWYDEFAGVYVEIIEGVQDTTPIYVLVPSQSAAQTVRSWLQYNDISTHNVDFLALDYDSIWIRDFGPIPIKASDGKVGFVDSIYYPYRVFDDAVPTLLANYFDVSVYRMPAAFEGGNFLTDGEGLCLMTTATADQNPYYTQSELNGLFRDYLGCRKIVWVPPLYNEETGHIDMFFKYLANNKVIVGQYSSSQDYYNSALLDETASSLTHTTDANGDDLSVYRIPMPSNADGVWRTYTNSLIVNNKVLVPTYDRDQTKEQTALALYAELLPGYQIVAIDSSELVTWAGAIHCITMTFPKGQMSAIGYASGSTPSSSSTTTTPTNDCGDVTYEGTCNGEVLEWCENGSLKMWDCAAAGKRCGLDAGHAFYTCL